MTNRFALAGFGLTVFLGAAVSCSKDVTSVTDLTNEEIRKQAAKDSSARVRDSLLKEGGRVIYTVQVVDGGKSAFASGASTDAAAAGTSSPSSAGVGGVKVTTTQFGKVATVTTDPTGMAVFPDMRVGKIAVEIDDDTYTPASFTAELTPPPAVPATTAQNITRNASTRVPVFPLTGVGTATVSGVVTIESDLTNGAAELASGIGVSASIITDSAFMAIYVSNGGEQSGKVLSITYKNAISSTTSSGIGGYTLTLPATADGLRLTMNLSDFAGPQALLLPTLNGQEVFGAQTVRTIFTQAAGVVPSTIPAVRPAYIDFGAPSGTGINQPPATAAVANAVISSGNVVSLNITDAGRGYTQAPNVVITSATGAGASATVALTNGRVTGLAVVTPGSGYVAGNAATLVSSGTGATAVADISRDVVGVNVTAGGSGYSAAPSVSITGGGGTGATATANVLGSVASYTITNAGTNYTTVPIVQITGGGGSGATATATLTPGSIRSITVPAAATTFFTVDPAVTFVGADGNGAAATASAQGLGRIQGVAINTAGNSYTSAPTVTFVGGGGGGAIGVAILNATGGVASITMVNQGDGYTSTPTVTLTGGGGSAATGTVTIERRVSVVTLTAVGTNYTSATTGAAVRFNGAAIPGTDLLLNRSLAAVNVTVAGANYTSAPTVAIIGDGSGAAATAQIRFSVGSISVTSSGSGYKSVPTVTITGDGTAATATAVLGNGVLAGVTITNPGAGYTAPPNFIVTGGGAVTEEAVVTATVAGGRVTGATITSAGKGYTVNPTFAIQTFLDPATANANIETGTVVAVNVTNPGLGYKGVPVIQLSSSTGSGAAATAVLDAQGRVSAINVTAAGSNYATAPTLDIVVPNSATRAKGTVTVNALGVVTGVAITAAGEGYSSAPTATITPAITGKGSGAVVDVRVVNGQVAAVIVVNGGTGYLGQNTPGNFFPVSGATVAGQSYRFSQPAGAALTLRSGVGVVNDIFMGTGTRQVP